MRSPSLRVRTEYPPVGSQSLPGWTRRLGGHRRSLEVVFAAIFYLAFACYFTWPIVTDLSHVFYGAAGDAYGSMAFYRELVDHHHNPFLPGTISQFSQPLGQAIPWTRDLASTPSVLTVFTLTAILGPMAANGVYILAGFTATGLITFLFVRRLTGSTWAALLSGWALAFYPFAVINGAGHYDYIWTGMLVLGVWRMLELLWRPSIRNGALAGLAVAFGMWWAPYFILFGGVAYATTLLVSLLIAWHDRHLREVLAPQAVAASIVVLFLGGLVALSTGPVGNSLGVRINNTAQLNTYSARPLEYVLPDSGSPLFGHATASYLTTHIHGSNPAEATLYVGISVILLALVSFVALLRRRLPPELSRAVIVLGAIALVAVIASAPPEGTVLGVQVPFPSHFIARVTSTWRVYSRFVVVVMLALVALAAMGLQSIVRRRGPAIYAAIMLIASVTVVLDLWPHAFGITNRLTDKWVPSVYKVLRKQPSGVVAEYPLVPNGENATYDDLFFQNVHGKPMINGYLQGTASERRALSLANPADPTTAPRLATLGVRYALVENAPPGYGLTPPGTPGRGFRLIYHDAFGALYDITAEPSGPALAAPSSGFDDTETDAAGSFNWLTQHKGRIELAGACSRCGGVLSFTIASFARPRLVTLAAAGGRVLLRKLVSSPDRLRVAVSYVRRTELMITASPGPQSISKTIGGPDSRTVSVQIRDLSFTSPRAVHGGSSKIVTGRR